MTMTVYETKPSHYSRSQVEMTLPGNLVAPAPSPKVKKLLDAKYKIFRETIEIQKRWRQQMVEAAS